ncbi:uncharacterized protein LOC117570402 isoform X1 [Drosophila albomicans]|uniref:Uncharacterized protein LOC117570402 isoform X1 n=1 Tax=Drosophila albomicans TaxID=7291 RepID=A0A6P8WW10_DROAB|nr:uncharacterized protein LOC117570402 isoform X1 [Drosophila albomicans]
MVKPLEKAGFLELHTAGLIIGWLGVIGSVLIFIIAAFTLGEADKIADNLAPENGEESGLHNQAEAAVSFLGVFLMGVCIMSAVISGLLIYGINKNRHSMLLPWLVLGTFGVVFSYFNLLAALFAFVAGPHNFLDFLYQVFSTALQSYFYYVIYSLYMRMKMDTGIGSELAPPPAAAVPYQQNDPAYSNYDKVASP